MYVRYFIVVLMSIYNYREKKVNQEPSLFAIALHPTKCRSKFKRVSQQVLSDQTEPY